MWFILSGNRTQDLEIESPKPSFIQIKFIQIKLLKCKWEKVAFSSEKVISQIDDPNKGNHPDW